MDCLVINGYVTGNTGLVIHRTLRSKMDDDAAREDACREYQSSLEDLTFNSKPHINMLTILAEENLQFAKDIVAIIEAQINKARTTEKLPVLYLVDSIVKNVGGEYLAVFTKNLVTSFICVFEKVDENIRKSLFKLRSTWDDIFPLKKLYALDVRVNAHDPAWPIKPLPPTVNASIHVNPKFLKQAEEVTSPKASPPQPVPPAPQPAPSISEASITQEQLIRQQLLSKQKQLLELQHKKIELELEQTKAQLAANVVLTLPPAGNPPALNTVVPKPTPPAPVIKPWIPSQADIKPPTRDPRLNRVGPQHKEQSGSKKDGHTMGVATHTPEKRLPEKSSKPERTRPPKKELFEEKPKAKSPSPMAKGVLAKSKHSEAENVKSADAGKKDPRLRKHQLEKGDPKEEEVVKEKKRCTEKKEKEEPIKASELNKAARGKLVNGSVGKHERSDAQEKSEVKAGGNARTNARKRTRSRSRSRSPSLPSQKRKERRSPKGRARSDSASPPPSHKLGKARQSSGKHAHAEDSPQHGKARDERATPKKSPSEPRRTKRSPEERHPEARDSQSPRTHSESKDSKENSHRWKSGWGENKHLKLSEEAHGKAGPQRHKSYPGSQRPTTPRTPKQHRLSVDANLQIPEVLNSVSKRDLLRKASIRLENGEISKDDFLNVAHQIKQLFQYQEEKQRSDSWEGSSEDGQKFPAKKKPLLSTPPSGQTQPDSLSDAELSYYEHKSRLRKTQLPQRQGGEGWDGEDSQEEGDSAAPAGGKPEGGRAAAHPSPLKFPRPPRDRHSKERAEEQQPPATMIEEYNHGREFPRLKSLQGLRFRRRADPRDPNASDCLKNEREWNSPLSERQRYDEREEQKSGYDAPRRYGGGPDLRHDDPLKHGRLPPSLVHRSSASSSVSEGPARKSPVVAYERERLSPLEQQDAAGLSPVPRFESPTSEHSDDGPLELPRPILKRPPPGPLAATRQLGDSPGHTPPHAPEGVAAATGVQRYDGQPSRYDGPGRHHPPGRFDGGPGAGRFDGPGGSHGPNRYDGPPQQGPGRFDGPGRFEPTSMPQGPMRGGDPQGIGRYEGPAPSQGPGRYDAPVSQQPSRFDGPGPGPGGFDGHMQPKHFDGPRRFDNPHMQPGPGRFEGPMGFQPNPIPFDGPPNQSGPIRFDGPGNTPGPIRFDPPGQPGPMRFDMMHHQGMPQRFDGPPGQQGPPRFCGPPNMQPPLRPGGPMYDPMSNPGGPQQPQNFNMPNQRFPEPINPQFSAAPLPFSGQQNMPQGVNFNMPPGPNSSGFPNSFSQSGPPPFYTPGAPVGNMNAPPPTGNMQPQMNMLPNLGQPPFLPPNPVPFSQPAPQFRPPESHFGQVDVNDLLTKLISTGIIRPTKTETTATGTESTSTPPATPAVVEEEEEEEEQEEDDDVPDLTGFVIEDMKQRYDSVVTKLYTGIQCYSCGMRFTASQTDVYADHLDWHYRLNRSEKDISKKVTHRRWYYSQVDWIEFEEIADLEERAKSLFFEKVNEEVVQKTQEAAKEKEFQSVCAAADVVDESCEICQEPFEMYWEEEEEEWHLRNAIRVDEMTYHPSCFEDYKNTSSFLDCTPSPNKLLTENPLSAFVKREEEEQTSCCITVKEEMESEVGATQNLMEEIQVKMEEEVQVSAIS